MTPAFSITVGGTAANVNDRLLALEVTDQEGNRSDSVRIMIDDRDGRVMIPDRGAKISIALGYRETGVFPMGLFVVDQVTASGWPMQIEVTGRSADLTEEMKEQRSKTYKDKTISDIVSEIAQRHGLTPGAMGSIASFKYSFLVQTEESDLNFLTRLAMRHDCIFAVKNGRLIFKKRGESIEAFHVIVHPSNVMSYSVTYQDRQKHSEGHADWWDKNAARRMRSKKFGSGGRAKYRVGQIAEDGQAQADEMAQSAATANKRAEKQLDMTVVGDPAIMAESILEVVGIKAGVDGLYRVKSVVHSLTSNGYRTNIQAEDIL